MRIRSLPIVKGVFLAFVLRFTFTRARLSCLVLFCKLPPIPCPVLQNSFSALACFSYSIRHAHLIHSFISTHFEPRPLSRLRLSGYKFSGLHVFPDIWHCALTKLPVPWIHSHVASRGPGWPLTTRPCCKLGSQPHPIQPFKISLGPDRTYKPVLAVQWIARAGCLNVAVR